jgi:Mn-dependent DtxR family transcriptional regulator
MSQTTKEWEAEKLAQAKHDEAFTNMYEALKKIEDCPNVCNCCKDEAAKAIAKAEGSKR